MNIDRKPPIRRRRRTELRKEIMRRLSLGELEQAVGVGCGETEDCEWLCGSTEI